MLENGYVTKVEIATLSLDHGFIGKELENLLIAWVSKNYAIKHESVFKLTNEFRVFFQEIKRKSCLICGQVYVPIKKDYNNEQSYLEKAMYSPGICSQLCLNECKPVKTKNKKPVNTQTKIFSVPGESC